MPGRKGEKQNQFPFSLLQPDRPELPWPVGSQQEDFFKVILFLLTPFFLSFFLFLFLLPCFPFVSLLPSFFLPPFTS